MTMALFLFTREFGRSRYTFSLSVSAEKCIFIGAKRVHAVKWMIDGDQKPVFRNDECSQTQKRASQISARVSKLRPH